MSAAFRNLKFNPAFSGTNFFAVLAASVLFLAPLAAAQESLSDVPPVENVHQAVYFLSVHKSMEEDSLRHLFEAYQAKRAEEQDALDALDALNFEADARLSAEASPEREAEMRDTLARLNETEAKLVEITAELRRLRNQLAETRERIARLERKMAELLGALPSEPQNVTGTWLVSLQPMRLTGEMRLFQNGVLVSGSYRLSGNWRGNVRGYVAGGQVVLERIDAELGLAGEFAAALSTDGKELNGRWTNFDLSSAPTSGIFTARRLKR